MIIKSIQLENFKSHLNTNLDFDTGISIIMGDNGAGKSSILESISFALFKEYSGKKMDRLINNDRDHLKVVLEFMANGRTYKVIRKRKRNSSPESMLYIEDDDKFSVIEKGDAAVTSAIENIIDLDKNLFLNAVYVRQGEIASLITKNPAEKKEMMGRLLGVEELENSWKNMKFVIDEYSMQEIHINGKLENLGKITDEKTEKEENRDELISSLEESSSKLKEAEEKFNILKRAKEFFDQKEINYNNINQKLIHNESILEMHNKDKESFNEKIRSINDKEARIKDIREDVDKIDSLEKLKEKIFDLKELENQKKTIINTLQKIQDLKSIVSKNKESYNTYIALDHQIRELFESRKEYEGSDILLKNNKDKLEILKDNVDKLEKGIAIKLEDYAKILEEDVVSIDQIESSLEFKKNETDEKLKSNSLEYDKIIEYISDLKGQNKEVSKSLEELESADDICPVCESELEENRKEELILKHNTQIGDNNNQINSLNKKLEFNKSEMMHIENKKMDVQKINIDMLKRENKEINDKKDEILKIEQLLVGIIESANKLNDLDAEINEKNRLKDNLYGDYQEYLGALKSLNSSEDYEELSNSLISMEDDIEPLKSSIDKMCIENAIKIEDVGTKLSNIRILKEEYDKLCGEIADKAEKINKLNNTEFKIKEINKEIKKQKEELVNVGYNKDKHLKSIEKMNYCQEYKEELQNSVGVLKGQLSETKKRISELNDQIQDYNKDKKELYKIGRFIGLLNEIRKLYGKDGLQKDLRNRSRPLIESNTLGFFNKFNFEYSDIKLDENYDVTLYGPSGENTLDMMSGGEIIAAAIALRLGIAKSLLKGNLELMILDEPTVHLDSYRRHELIDVIKRLSVIPQMIIVTHDEGLEEAASNILRIKKENGISKLTDIS